MDPRAVDPSLPALPGSAPPPRRLLTRLLVGLLLVGLLLGAGACPDEEEAPTVDSGLRPSCTPGEKRCLGTLYRVCDASGAAWQQTDCAQSSGRCLSIGGTPQCTALICDPDSRGCGDDGLTTRTCASDGKSWKNGAVCALAKGETCQSGICVNACQFEAKNKQNIGCQFYPVNLENESVDTMGVVVGNPNKATATVKLFNPDKLLETRQIKGGQLTTFLIVAGAYMVKGTDQKKHAFKLLSDLPVAAYQFSPLNKAEQRSNDASLLLASTALGKSYFVLSAPVTSTGTKSTVTIVGTEAGTQVTVTPSVATLAGGPVPALKAGQAYTATLGDQEILQLVATADGADLTGTRVKGLKPIAVFGGHTCANIPRGKTYCDHIQEQMFPVETWGQGYLAAKFMPRGAHAEDDLWRVMGSEDGTTVTLQGAPELGTTVKVNAGTTYDFTTSKAFVLKGDRPIALGHYIQSEQEVVPPLDSLVYTDGFQTVKGCTQDVGHTNMGDPALAVSVPWIQFRKEYTFLTPDTYRYDFITLTFPYGVTSPDVLLDGKPATLTLFSVGDTGYSFARLRVTDGPHHISAATTFGIEVYGYDCNVSYAYSGGQDLKAINPIL